MKYGVNEWILKVRLWELNGIKIKCRREELNERRNKNDGWIGKIEDDTSEIKWIDRNGIWNFVLVGWRKKILGRWELKVIKRFWVVGN